MRKNIFQLSFIILLLAFVTGHALAIPYEYSITGTASYRDSNGDLVFSGQSITGSFVMSDPTINYSFDWIPAIFNLSDLNILGESFSLSGTGMINNHLEDGEFLPEPWLNLRLETYATPTGEQYSHLFYNYDGSLASHAEQPDLITFSNVSVCTDNSFECRSGVDSYTFSTMSAARVGAVPEPSTLILLGSGLIGLIRMKRIFRKQ